jgi:hypothetical protein
MPAMTEKRSTRPIAQRWAASHPIRSATMKYRELIERIERIEPNLAPHEVARFCLLLINSTDDLDTLADDSVLTAAWQEMSLRMQVATDQHEAMTEELEQLGNSDPQKFTQDQIWVLLRAIKVQSQILKFYVGYPVLDV